jgi:acyl-CoA oxidase
MMSTIQAMLFLAWRIATLYDEGNIDIAQIAMSKAWVSDKARDVARWGREVCGGNGLLHENYVMRALTDLEGVYTYEGTYEVNTLVAGRHLTGLSAFTK